MRNTSKLVLAALAASAILALAGGPAGARSFSVNERNFELIWNSSTKQKLSFRDEGGHNIECNVTLLGRFNSNTISKTTNNNQGTINHGELRECVGGGATIKTETMPWNLRYRSFTGALPTNITGISTGLIGAAFRVEAAGISCEPVTSERSPGVGIVESFTAGEPENIRADETSTIPLAGFLCSFVSPSRFSGRGLIRNLPNTAKIRVTLI